MLYSIAFTSLLVALTINCSQVSGYTSPQSYRSRSNCQQFATKKDNADNRNPYASSSMNAYEIEEFNKGLVNSPGFVNTMPVSTNAQSRKELAKLVVSAAVIYLSLNIRFKEMQDKVNYQKKTQGTAIDNGSPIIMPNGIQYIDIFPIIMKGELEEDLLDNSSVPKRGDEMVLLAKLYYNGFQVETSA